jgi:hypothetical protein
MPSKRERRTPGGIAGLAAVTALAICIPADLAMAKGKGHGKGQGHGQGVNVVPGPGKSQGHKAKSHSQGVADQVHENQALDGLITAAEQATILGFLQQKPGFVGSTGSLPPGIAKNLARGKPLPPGIAKQQLPPSLLSQLPPRPGYEWWAVGNDIVLTSIATGLVVDLIANAF